ncbi:MAG: hypothetical protein P8J63_04500 [Verrucomicrobiota bacterium]|mgnify:CR=1 FL=1|nr:hypothetical protein [Verrucomicrobiota bacterium]
MKLTQLIKHATCMAALSAFMVGCGGADDVPDPMEDEDPPPPRGGPDGTGGEGEEGTEGGPEGN